jgi:hypothetical protein
MTVQWTVHIPQAMQRHGASIRPSNTPCDNTMAYRVQQANAQSDMPPRRTGETEAEAA